MGRILVLGVTALVACYSPPHPACGFICGTGGACPDDYTCARDNYCHLNGSPATLVCMVDAAIPDAGPDADLTAPRVISSVPNDGAINVARNIVITATFDIDVAGVDATSMLASVPVAGSLAGTVFYDAPSHTASFMPATLLPPGTFITVHLTSAIHRPGGNPLPSNTMFTFTTVDDVAPTLASSMPLANDTNVPVTTTIVVTFSEIVTGVGTTSFTVAQGANAIAGTITTTDSITYTFTPTANLPAASPITVTLTGAITDQATNALVPVQLTFTTQ